LISDRPIEVWLEEFRHVKKEYPDHVLIASIMEEYSKDRWQELTKMVQDTGVDAFELNFSCPHGMTERKMGSEMGEHPDLTQEVTSWVKEVSKIPVWAKMTPNITNIKEPSLAAVRGGADGISAINTILSVIGVNPRHAAADAYGRRLYGSRWLFSTGRETDRFAHGQSTRSRLAEGSIDQRHWRSLKARAMRLNLCCWELPRCRFAPASCCRRKDGRGTPGRPGQIH
jgi:hypothetical protein